MAEVHKVTMTVFCQREDVEGVKRSLADHDDIDGWFYDAPFDMTGFQVESCPATPQEAAKYQDDLAPYDDLQD